MNETSTDKEHKKITHMYVAFIVSILMQFLPSIIMQVFGGILLTVVFICLYVMRWRSEKNSLTAGHMTFIIRTIWIGSLLLSVGSAIGGYAIYTQGDNTAFHFLYERVMSASFDAEDIPAAFRTYMKDNLILVIMAAIVSFVPGIVYLLYRTGKGLSRALKGLHIDNPKAWF